MSADFDGAAVAGFSFCFLEAVFSLETGMALRQRRTWTNDICKIAHRGFVEEFSSGGGSFS